VEARYAVLAGLLDKLVSVDRGLAVARSLRILEEKRFSGVGEVVQARSMEAACREELISVAREIVLYYMSNKGEKHD
jgi:hypothetical protein